MVTEIEKGHSNGRIKGDKTAPPPVWTPKSAGNARDKVEQIMARATADKVRFVNLQFTDVMGIVKSVAIPLHQFEDACLNGKWFDGSSIEGFARIAESDMFLVPDLSTWAVMPWERAEESTARAICWGYNPALTPADSAVTLKYTLNAIAAEHGLHCTFIPKPIFGINGSGMHTHQSLSSLEGSDNLFADAEDAYGISMLAKKYIAGQLK